MPDIDALMRQGLISPDAVARFMSDASPDPVQAGQQYAADYRGPGDRGRSGGPPTFPFAGGTGGGSLGGGGPSMVVARKMPDGSVKYGNPGQVHTDLMSRKELSTASDSPEVANSMGFAFPNGRFLTRSEALDFASRNEPQRAAWSAQQPQYGLDAATYNEATPVRGGSLNVTGRGAQRFSNQVSLDAANRDVPQPTLPKLRFMENEPSRELMEGSNKPVMGRPVGSGRQWSDAEIAHLTDGLNAGKSGRMIAEELGLPESQVRAQIQRSGLKSRADTTNRKYLP